MTKTTRTLGTLIITATLALTVAPAAGATTVASAAHPNAVALPAPRGGGNGGGGGGGGHSSGTGGGGSGGGHGDGGQQYNDAVTAVDNNVDNPRHRRTRVRPDSVDPKHGCGDPYYSSYYGCYQPQA